MSEKLPLGLKCFAQILLMFQGREYVERDGNNCTVESQGRYNYLGSGSLSSLPSFSGASSYSCDDESKLQNPT